MNMKKFLLAFSVAMLVSLFALALVGLYLEKSTSKRTALKRQAIANAGDEVYLSDYAVDPIPADQDGLTQFEFASADLDLFMKDYETAFAGAGLGMDVLDMNRTLSSKQIDQIEQIVADFPAMFEQLDRVSECTQFVGASWKDNDPLDALASQAFQRLRIAARAYCSKALVAAYRGDGDEALRICEKALKLRRVANVRPSLLSCLVDAATQNIVFDTANHVLRVSKPSPAAIAQFNHAISGIDNIASLTDGMKGERAFGLSVIMKVKQDGDTGDLPGFPGGSALLGNWFGKAYLNDDEEMYLDLMAANIEVIGKPKTQRDPVLLRIENELLASKFRHVLSKLIISSTSGAHDAIDRTVAKLRSLRMICDNYEALQNATSEPLGNVQLDPFIDSPMQSKQTKDGWVVYSVGENLVDDGGEVVPDNSGSIPVDIGFGPLLPPLNNPAAATP